MVYWWNLLGCSKGFLPSGECPSLFGEAQKVFLLRPPLSSGKKQNEYNYALTTIVQAAKMANHKLNLKYIMTDHEKSLKNALQEVFPKAKDLRCQFHFEQALWKNAGKKSLKTKNNIANTSRLIIILTILVHLPLEIRKGYFESLKAAYPIEYQEFLDYFTKEWRNKEFLEWTDSNRKRQEKTNNCCESFHSYFSNDSIESVIFPPMNI